jgi:sec-independent protein translocase protein TatB
MFGIGWGEMVVIGLVALLVVGPEKLPEVAKTVGRFYGQLRQAANEAGAALTAEADMIKAETRAERKPSLSPSAGAVSSPPEPSDHDGTERENA